jgi:hypothetical protein
MNNEKAFQISQEEYDRRVKVFGKPFGLGSDFTEAEFLERVCRVHLVFLALDENDNWTSFIRLGKRLDNDEKFLASLLPYGGECYQISGAFMELIRVEWPTTRPDKYPNGLTARWTPPYTYDCLRLQSYAEPEEFDELTMGLLGWHEEQIRETTKTMLGY